MGPSNNEPRLPLVSVIIPAYNATDTIIECVESVLGTDYPQLEVIVADDCSTDDTAAKVNSLLQTESRVKYCKCASNGGPSRARNLGAKFAQGDLYFFLDSDTLMTKDSLNCFVTTMQSADAVVGAYHHIPLNDGLVPAYKALLNSHLFSRNGIIAYESFNTAAGGVRAELFDAINGFDERVKWGMDIECEEFADRILPEHQLLLDPGIKVKHRFPSFWVQTENYFTRVSYWMERFPDHSFESGGTADQSTGLATAACAAAGLSAPLLVFNSMIWPLTTVLLLGWLYGYRDTFSWIAQKRPAYLLPSIVLNAWFSHVITAGAIYGQLRRYFAPRLEPELTGEAPRLVAPNSDDDGT